MAPSIRGTTSYMGAPNQITMTPGSLCVGRTVRSALMSRFGFIFIRFFRFAIHLTALACPTTVLSIRTTFVQFESFRRIARRGVLGCGTGSRLLAIMRVHRGVLRFVRLHVEGKLKTFEQNMSHQVQFLPVI